MDYFKNLKDYREYFVHNKLDKVFKIYDLDKRTYNEEYDQHFFELCEKPIGKFNQRQIEFSLGKKWIRNLI